MLRYVAVSIVAVCHIATHVQVSTILDPCSESVLKIQPINASYIIQKSSKKHVNHAFSRAGAGILGYTSDRSAFASANQYCYFV